MKFDLASIQPKWKEFNGLKLLIGLYPQSLTDTTYRQNESGQLEIVQKGADRKKAYLECFKDAEGLTDQNDKPIKILDEVMVGEKKTSLKEALYDYERILAPGLSEFVLIEAKAKLIESEAVEKNLDSGLSGGGTKTT